MTCYEERHPLLLNWCISSLRCRRKVEGAPLSIYKVCYGPRPAISVIVDFQIIAHKIPYFRYSVCKRNWMLCYGERYILMLKWPIASLLCMSNVGGASESIYKTFDVHIVLFSLTSILKLHTKYQIWGSISARERG